MTQDAPLPLGITEAIRAFLQADTEPPGKDLYPLVFKQEMMFPLQRQRELAQMMAIARTVNPTTVYEIGADKGGSLYHWCKCFPSVTRVIACEIRGTPYAVEFERAFSNIKFLWLPQSSYNPETLNQVERWLSGAYIDCLFIDGDKGQFVRDFNSHLPMMRPTGIVFMHDIQDEQTGRAFRNVIRRGYRHTKIIDTSESIEMANRVPANSYEQWLKHWHGRSCGVGVVYLGS